MKLSVGATSVSSTRLAARARSASSASMPATPPPAMTTRWGFGLMLRWSRAAAPRTSGSRRQRAAVDYGQRSALGAAADAAAGKPPRRRQRPRLELARSQPRRQPARRDLARWPPQALLGDLGRAGSAWRLRAQVARTVDGAQQRAHDRPVRPRRVLGPGAPGDLLGDD